MPRYPQVLRYRLDVRVLVCVQGCVLRVLRRRSVEIYELQASSVSESMSSKLALWSGAVVERARREEVPGKIMNCKVVVAPRGTAILVSSTLEGTDGE